MKTRPHTDAELTPAQLKELTKRLLIMRRELVSILDTLKRQATVKDDCTVADAAEAASLQESRARASGIADQHGRTIAEIDHALRRLENGRYGISEVSGDPIAYERLTLIPWARTGVDEPEPEAF